jgi:hypothetical protein
LAIRIRKTNTYLNTQLLHAARIVSNGVVAARVIMHRTCDDVVGVAVGEHICFWRDGKASGTAIEVGARECCLNATRGVDNNGMEREANRTRTNAILRTCKIERRRMRANSRGYSSKRGRDGMRGTVRMKSQRRIDRRRIDRRRIDRRRIVRRRIVRRTGGSNFGRRKHVAKARITEARICWRR